MPKTNKERLQDNNIELQNIKTGIDNLPEYQDIKPIYGSGELNLLTLSTSVDSGRVIKSGNVVCIENGQKLYFYYNGEYACSFTKSVNVSNYACFCKVTDEYCIVMVAAQSVWYKKVETIKFEYSTKTATQIGIVDISSLGSSAGDTYLPDGTLIMTSGNKVCRYIEETNSFKYYNFTMSNTSNNRGTMNILHSNYNSSYSNYATLNKLLYNDATDTYTVISKAYPEVLGVNFYGNKIFRYGNVYELNDDLTIGRLLNSNVILNATGGTGPSLYCLDDKHYFLQYTNYSDHTKDVPPTIYEFDEDTNTFSVYGTDSKFGCWFGGSPDVFVGKWVNNSFQLYDWTDTTYEIGFIKNGTSYFYGGQGGYFSNENILAGTKGYTSGFQLLYGTMPNNGALNYTPTTSQQTIPAGYTSGGTISAVDNTIDENIVAENIRKDVTILGVTGTVEGGINITNGTVDGHTLILSSEPEIN